ncbi:methyl-accepting chemotaxis protein [Methylophaga thiooxydans]|uniref:methyl-accepting chemotaxis protein n=1 Tax=Methylophaga thiooxydans TaxID=392484 RepID=UPI0023530D2C|nr:methyl-accepting chemotaxis protein [Methylophaga thiooxydans]
MNFSIQQRFSIWAGLGLLSVVLMAVFVGVWQFDRIKQTLSSQSYDVTRSQVEDYLRVLANDTSAELSMPLHSAMYAIQATASAIEAVAETKSNLDKRDLAIRMLAQTLTDHPDFLATYVAFEPDAFDDADDLTKQAHGSDAAGRFMPYVTRDNNGFQVALLEGLEDSSLDQNGIRVGEYYLCSKESGESCVIDPYLYPVEDEQVLLSSLVAPIKQKGQFIGIAGVDISASFLQSVISDVDAGLYKGQGRILLVSPRGIISGHSQHTELIGQNLSVLEKSISENLKEAAVSGETKIINSKQRFIVLKPFHLPGNQQRWVAYLEVPEEIVMADVALQKQFLEAAQKQFISATTVLGIFLSLLGVVTIWLVARKSIRPVTEMTELVASIAEGEGDLTQRLNISYRDETGKLSGLLNTFINKLHNLVLQLLPVASNVSSLSADGRNISVETSIQMLELESLIEDMVLAMSEMAAAAEQIATNAERTSKFSQHANDAATKGVEVVQKKGASIKHVSESVRQSEAVLQEQEKDSRDIVHILSVIERSAKEIKNLAVNMTDDAVTTSKNKTGFASAAEQIRMLAGQTQQATVDIYDKITTLQQRNQQASDMVRLSGQQALETVGLAQQEETVLNDINLAIEEVTDMTLQIASATEQQNAVCEEVNHNLSEVSRLVHQTSKGAQQLRGVSNELDQAASRLQEKLSLFKV